MVDSVDNHYAGQTFTLSDGTTFTILLQADISQRYLKGWTGKDYPPGTVYYPDFKSSPDILKIIDIQKSVSIFSKDYPKIHLNK